VKTKFSALESGKCFSRGRRGGVWKKLPDGRMISVSKKTGKTLTRVVKKDPNITTVSCPLNLLGTGLSRVPDTLIEIG
jgi:hypothetical protein